jgi:hypothetical protein
MSPDEPHNRQPDESPNGDAAVDRLVDRLTAAVRDLPVPDGPDEQTLAATLDALRRRAPAARTTHNGFQRILTMKSLMKLAAAACVALALGVVFLANPWGNSLAFADVIQQVKQAKSVRFKATIDILTPGSKTGQKVACTMTIVGNRMRQELPGVVQVMDLAHGEMLMLQEKDKTGVRVTMKNAPANVQSMNVLEQFRAIKPDQGKDVGLKTFDGRELRGFAIEQPNNIGTMTAWADPKTQELVRVEVKMSIPTMPAMTTLMTDFEWDVPVDKALLSLDVPAGYKIESMTMDASPAGEADLLEALRVMATANDAKFPETFGMSAMGELFKGTSSKPATPEQVKARLDELRPLAMKIARGIGFVMPNSGADWHYAGSGVKLGEKGRAVMWYKPKDSEKYRVIDADLTVHEVAADALPKVEAKALTPGQFPTTGKANP